MKKCEKCGKVSEELTEVLMTGVNGFRRYKVCPKCTGPLIQHIHVPEVKPVREKRGGKGPGKGNPYR